MGQGKPDKPDKIIVYVSDMCGGCEDLKDSIAQGKVRAGYGTAEDFTSVPFETRDVSEISDAEVKRLEGYGYIPAAYTGSVSGDRCEIQTGKGDEPTLILCEAPEREPEIEIEPNPEPEPEL